MCSRRERFVGFEIVPTSRLLSCVSDLGVPLTEIRVSDEPSCGRSGKI
jgi:hypothetical protein